MSKIPHRSNKSIHDALRALVWEVKSDRNAANIDIAEAADRISELGMENERLHSENTALREQLLQKTQQLEAENAALKIERNRYKVALQDIASSSTGWARERAKMQLRKEAQP